MFSSTVLLLAACVTVSHAQLFLPPTDLNVWGQGQNFINLPDSQLTDVNGDGLPDFVQAYVDTTGTGRQPNRHVWLNNGIGWVLASASFVHNNTSHFAKKNAAEAEHRRTLDRLATAAEKMLTTLTDSLTHMRYLAESKQGAGHAMDVLTDKQVAIMLSLPHDTVLELLRTRQLRGHKFAKSGSGADEEKWRVSRRAVVRFLDGE